MGLSDLVRSVPVVDAPNVWGSLSPSRASDFTSCPLKYRFRVLDHLPEPVSPEAARGTLVHSVLERVFDLPVDERTLESAQALLAPAWEDLLLEEPELAEVSTEAWWKAAHDLVAVWFAMEDPTRLSPAARELFVEHDLPSGLRLRGIVDRVDRAADGAVRIVDYKTGRAPSELFEGRALFQMKFYALVVWLTRGIVAKELVLLYLGDGQRLSLVPDEQMLLTFQRTLEAIGAAVRKATDSGDWRAKKSALCGWCAHQALCPEFGGTPPPLPPKETAAADDAVEIVDLLG
jgi:putative RecB family exonuclease